MVAGGGGGVHWDEAGNGCRGREYPLLTIGTNPNAPLSYALGMGNPHLTMITLGVRGGRLER